MSYSKLTSWSRFHSNPCVHLTNHPLPVPKYPTPKNPPTALVNLVVTSLDQWETCSTVWAIVNSIRMALREPPKLETRFKQFIL